MTTCVEPARPHPHTVHTRSGPLGRYYAAMRHDAPDGDVSCAVKYPDGYEARQRFETFNQAYAYIDAACELARSMAYNPGKEIDARTHDDTLAASARNQ